MRTPTRLAAFGLGLVAVFGAAFGLGRLAGPDTGGTATGHSGSGGTMQPWSASSPGGLQISERGYTLELSAPTAPIGSSSLTFSVLGADGRAATSFATREGRQMHVVLVQRDTTGFVHLHPTMDARGTWAVPVDLRSGCYRVFADFQPAGRNPLTLGADLTVSGGSHPGLLPEPAADSYVDSYMVRKTGRLAPGNSSTLSFDVTRNGRRIDRQSLNGAAHLVVLRVGDLAYLRVRLASDWNTFDVETPSPGTYRLFLEFRDGNTVRVAEFTEVAAAGGGAPTPPAIGHTEHK